jgi:hypothetical protein
MTFGASHPLANCCIMVRATDMAKARKVCFETFANKWSMLYADCDFDPSWYPGGIVGNILLGE